MPSCLSLPLSCYAVLAFRLNDSSVIRPGKTSPPIRSPTSADSSPSRVCRLAWLIAFGRSCFWTTFFVYAPLLMVVTGEGKLTGGLLVSAGNALLFAAVFWGRTGKRYSAREHMAAGVLRHDRDARCWRAFAVKAFRWSPAAILLCCVVLRHRARCAGLDAVPARRASYRAAADVGRLPHLSRPVRAFAAAGLLHRARLFRPGRGVRDAGRLLGVLRLAHLALPAEIDVSGNSQVATGLALPLSVNGLPGSSFCPIVLRVGGSGRTERECGEGFRSKAAAAPQL